MPIPGTARVCECQVIARQAGQMVMNTYHYYTNGAAFAETLVAANQAAEDFFNACIDIAAYTGMFNPLYDVRSVSAQLIWPTRFARGRFTPAAPLAGTRAGTITPPGTQWSAITLTDASGASSHGGNRYAGLNIADVDLGILEPAFIAVAVPGVQALYEPVTLAGVLMNPLVFNKFDPESSNQIVSYEVQEDVRTMSRRVVGRGK